MFNKFISMQPLVSVIVPVFKVEQYIDRTMNSLLNQTLKNIEIILVDDGSPDNCPKICDDYAMKDDRIKVIHKKNGGLGFARNSGLDIATGEYIMFVDGDDTIEKDACEVLYNTGKKYNADVISGNFNKEIRPGKWIKTNQPEGLQILKGKEIYNYMLNMIATAPYKKVERLYPVSVCITCIRKSLIENYKLRFLSEREVSSEDTVFKICLLKKANTLVRIPYSFYCYYLNGASLSHTFSMDKFLKLNKLHNELSKLLASNENEKLRIDRFIISDARMHFIRLVNSNSTDKIKLIKKMMKNEIWEKVKEYKPSYYPLYQKLFYLLIIYKKPIVLYLYIKLANLLKEIRK